MLVYPAPVLLAAEPTVQSDDVVPELQDHSGFCAGSLPSGFTFLPPNQALFGDASVSGGPVPTSCTFPGMSGRMNFDDFTLAFQMFDYLQPSQTYMDPAFHGNTADVEEPGPSVKSKVTQKRRRRGGQRRSVPVTDSQAALPKSGQDWSSVAAIREGSLAHSGLSGTAEDEFASMIAKWGHAMDLGKNLEHCNEVKAQLECEKAVALPVFKWILPATRVLALAKHGTRVIQTAIEVVQPLLDADNADLLDLLIDQLKGTIADLYNSPHGNHVVTKIIEVLPPARLGFLLSELTGTAISVAKHQYGCRLLERLIEHCTAKQVAGLIEELLDDAEPLCRHPFGNFVMQHIFEHGSQYWKDKIAERIVGDLPLLAKHRTASHVVQRALNHGKEEIQHIFVLALTTAKGEHSLVDVACSRYGSFVVEEMATIQAFSSQVGEALKVELPRLIESPYGRRAAAKFGLELLVV